MILSVSAPAGAQECEESTALLTGRVEDSEAGVSLPGVIVHISAADESAFSTEVVTGSDGTFSVCVPEGAETLTARAEFGGVVGEPVTLSAAPEGREPLVLAIGVSTGDAGNVGVLREGISRDVVGELGEVRGRLNEVETAEPVVGGRVDVAGTSTVSDETGAFILRGVEPGRHAIRIERLGYEVLEDSVQVEAGHVTSVTAELVTEALELEPLFVSVVRNPRLDQVGFYERKTLGERLGLGRYLTREDIERRNPARVSDFLDSVSLLDMITSCEGHLPEAPPRP